MEYLTTKFTTEYIIYDVQNDRLFLKVFSQGCSGPYYQIGELGTESYGYGWYYNMDTGESRPYWTEDPYTDPNLYPIIGIL